MEYLAMMNPEIIYSIYLVGLSIALPLTILLNLQENGLKRNIRKGSQIASVPYSG